ncbi:DUF4129 domain-containing protein [Rathayibacter soli]|uniref:DUF4129 domain-containing protein n=1 Tax=Rathayibacter soli TaxID=3144168 RepID=UPI0027E43EF2|nr:DUF4129 domain-containing protein [Glaciibacter superstes]
MKRSGAILIGCILLGAVLVVSVGLQGAAQFTGIRWVPDFSAPHNTNFPTGRQQPTGTITPLPAAPGAARGALDLSIVGWILVGIAALTAIVLVLRWLARRPDRTAQGLPPTSIDSVDDLVAEVVPEAVSAPVIKRGFSRAIASLDEEREPHDAIVKAWLGVQDAAAESGIQRRGAETPTEFTSRILRRVPADSSAVRTLLNAYLRVRFGDHPATEEDVEQVRRALQSLSMSWDAALNARAASVPRPPWERRS